MEANRAKKISAVLNTYNAELHLETVLKALLGFDEIVVCDMESTDRTVEIATRMGCRVVTFPRGDIRICEPARNFAIQSASFDWVLVVDADEIVTPELRDYLYRRISSGDCPDALRVPRRNMFLGRYTHSSPDYQTRFVRKDKVDWPPIIHCHPRIDGIVEDIPTRLKNVCLHHLDDATLSSRYAKQNTYSDYEVERRSQGKRSYGIVSFFMRPAWFFIRSFILQGGFRDGKRGLVRGLMSSVYQIMILTKLAERSINRQ